MTNLLLAFHLLGAACFFAGGALVGVLQLKAIRQERPSQVYAFLRLAPVGAALVGTGALLTLGFGIALAEHKGLGLSPAWIQASLGLWVAAMALGAFGGRRARRARHLAENLAAEGDAPSPELRALVSARRPLWASYASFALLVVILVLMVWQPGSSEATTSTALFPQSLRQRIVALYPQFGYLPTRLPGGVEYSRFIHPPDPSRGFHVVFNGPAGSDALSFSVYPAATAYPGTCDISPGHGVTVVTVNGYRIATTAGIESAWRCVTHDNVKLILQADAMKSGVDIAELETLVAYAAPFR